MHQKMKNKSKFGRRATESCLIWDDERNELNSLLRDVNIFYKIKIGKEEKTTVKIAVTCGRCIRFKRRKKQFQQHDCNQKRLE